MELNEIKIKIQEELKLNKPAPITKRFKFSREQLQDVPDLLEMCIMRYFEELGHTINHIKNINIENFVDDNTFSPIITLRIETNMNIPIVPIVYEPQEVTVWHRTLTHEQIEKYINQKDQTAWVCKLFNQDIKKFIGTKIIGEGTKTMMVQLITKGKPDGDN